jgi:large subunit ribosomal protein L30e
MDINKEIRRAVDTGKVAFGTKQTEKILAKNEGEMVIISSNIPEIQKEKLNHLAEIAGKKFFEHKISGLNLGSVCGKPFVISSMIIIDKGKSNILNVE